MRQLIKSALGSKFKSSRKHGNDDEKIGMISRSLIILVSLLPIVSLGKERPPNIVLFMAEDIGNDLACYGHPGVKTPTLDNLVANGIRYERFYTNSPICSPSRTSLMLGVHQGYSGGHHHRSNVKGAPELHYLTHYLREVGYTCMVGTNMICLLYTSPSPRDLSTSRMPSSA